MCVLISFNFYQINCLTNLIGELILSHPIENVFEWLYIIISYHCIANVYA